MSYSGVISNVASIIKAKSVEIGRLATLIVFSIAYFFTRHNLTALRFVTKLGNSFGINE